MTSRDAREQALRLLYAADAGALPDPPSPTGRPGRLVSGVLEHLEAIDALIEMHAAEWRLARMPAVDRSILRLGVYELRYTDTPVAVAISEAVELAKRYSTARSGAFVNGVLSAIQAER